MEFRELYIAELKAVGFSASDAEEVADWYLREPPGAPFPAHCRLLPLAAPNYDPSQPRNADGEWTSGGGARPREHRDKGFQDRYGSTDENALVADPQKNFKRGANALEAMERMRGGYIDKAMYREETGWIRFDWGDPGDPAHDYKHGHGISHILTKHGKDAKNLSDVIARGKAVKNPIEPDKIYLVTETAYAVVIPLNQSQRRMLTMFEPKANSRKLAEIKKYPPAPKRQGR